MIPEHPPADTLAREGMAMLSALRRALRAAGWTQARLAKEFDVGSATMKRWLHGRGLAFHALESLCSLAGLSIAELAQESHALEHERNEISLAQEEALTQDSQLSTVFFVIVAGWPPSEAVESFNFSQVDVDRHVARLERLALVDRLPGGRVRARIGPAYVWQRAPMRRHFDRYLKQHFFSLDYGDAETIFGSETLKLSPVGIARVRDRIEQFRADLRAIAQQDRRSATLPGEWFAVLAVARSMKPLIEGQ